MTTEPTALTVSDDSDPQEATQPKVRRGIYHPGMVKDLDVSAVTGDAKVVQALRRSFGDVVICPHCNTPDQAPVDNPIGGFLTPFDKSLRYRLRQAGVEALAYRCDCGEWSNVATSEVD